MVWKGIGIASRSEMGMFTLKSVVLFSMPVEVYLLDLYFSTVSDCILEVLMDYFQQLVRIHMLFVFH